MKKNKLILLILGVLVLGVVQLAVTTTRVLPLTGYALKTWVNPHRAANLLQSGWNQIENEEWDAAIRDLNEAIRLNPKEAQAYSYRAYALASKGETGPAITDYTTAIVLDPEGDATAYSGRGAAYAQQREFNLAIKDYDEALRLDPDDAQTHNNRAHAYHETGQFQKARSDFRKAIRLGEDDADSCNGLAWLLATCSDPELRDGKEAVELARKACELTDWKNGGWIDTLAAAYAETGDFDQAVKYQAQALAITKGDEKGTLEMRGRLELYRGKRAYREPAR